MAADPSARKSSDRKPVAYDESTIQTLDALEHIRLRTGMYIGRIGDGGGAGDRRGLLGRRPAPGHEHQVRRRGRHRD